MRARWRCVGRQPGVRQIQTGADHPGPRPRPQGGRHRDLAIGDLAERAAVLAGHTNGGRPLLRKAGTVENQHPVPIGNRGAHATPHWRGRPRRVGDEMLEGLIRPGIADARQHGAHRFAPTVAQQPEQISAERTPLRDVIETVLERLEPAAQSVQPHRRIARQHRRAAYRNRGTSTSPLSQFVADLGANPWI